MSADSLREQIAGAVASRRGATARVNDIDRLVADRVLALLGEVTVTEEWGVTCLGYVGRRETWRHDDEANARAEVAAHAHAPCQPRLVRRDVTRTEHVGEWEEIQ